MDLKYMLDAAIVAVCGSLISLLSCYLKKNGENLAKGRR